MTEDCYFDLTGGVYTGRDPARGPWAPDHCHAGPVAGALARSVEQRLGPDRQLVRLTIDLIRPVPMAGFTVAVEVMREGRRLATAAGELVATDGKVCARATAMLITPGPEHDYPTVPDDVPAAMHMAEPGGFPVSEALHDLPFFTNFVELRYPPGQSQAPGPTTVWMRTPALIAGEDPSPFQRLCPLSDCGNAIGRNADLGRYRFLNTDLTIVAHRPSAEEWMMSTARSHWQGNGIGLAEAHLSDSRGPIATALQSLTLEVA